MPDRPVTILPPTLQAVLAGDCVHLRRPEGTLSACQPGDRLWVREQFRLPRAFDHVAPLQALERGATPVFVVDEEGCPPGAVNGPGGDPGRVRFACELPRAWHRAHLVVRSIHRERLQDISATEIARAGHETEARYIAAWNAGVSLRVGASRRLAWASNPTVIVLGFDCVRAPIPARRSVAAAT